MAKAQIGQTILRHVYRGQFRKAIVEIRCPFVVLFDRPKMLAPPISGIVDLQIAQAAGGVPPREDGYSQPKLPFMGFYQVAISEAISFKLDGIKKYKSVAGRYSIKIA
jgi:hypothetical protein